MSGVELTAIKQIVVACFLLGYFCGIISGIAIGIIIYLIKKRKRNKLYRWLKRKKKEVLKKRKKEKK